MASINKLASGKWRVQVRCQGRHLSNSFALRKDAGMWARRIEREIDLGQKPAPKHKDEIKTVSDLIDCISRICRRLARTSAVLRGSAWTCDEPGLAAERR